MKILVRYIAKEISLYFILSLSIFMGLLVTLRMLRLTSLVVNKGVAFEQILTIFLSLLPTFLEIAIPMATLIGVMMAFARLSGDSEIIVIRASGISLNQLIKPVVIFGFFTTAITFVVSLYFRPIGYHYLSETLFEIATQQSTAGLTEGVFNKIGKLTLYAEKIDYKTGELSKVIVDDKRNPSNRQIVVARHGRIVSNSKDKTLTFLLGDGEIHSRMGGKYNVTEFVKNAISVDPSESIDEDEQHRDKFSREMLLPELDENIANQKTLLNRFEVENLDKIPNPNVKDPNTESEDAFITKKQVKEKIASLRMEVIRKFSFPFACLVFALLAMPLGIQPPRSRKTWGASLSIVVGTTVMVVYYGLLSLGTALGKKATIDPNIALWSPNLVFSLLAFFAIKKMGSEEWQSVAHMFEWIFSRVSLISRISIDSQRGKDSQ